MLLIAVAGCGASAPLSEGDYDAAAHTVSAATLSRRLDDLAADSMLGRGPGQRGDTMAVAYLEGAMRAIGLSPAYASGYRQPVTLHRLRARGTTTFRANGREVALDSSSMLLAAVAKGIHVLRDAPVVFVGFGIVAPEHGRDDYGEVDLHGKVALILDGEPPDVTQRRFGTLGAQGPHAFYFLKGRHALAHGAVGAVLLRSLDDSTLRARRRHLQDGAISGDADDAQPEVPVTIHLAADASERLAQALGTSIAALRAEASAPATRPRELPLRVDASVTTSGEPFTSHNVVGVVRGSDRTLRHECVVYLAHWDGFGIGPAINGDSIYNGALDNAAGVSEMLSIAEAMKGLPRAPRRTTVFVATTAEEFGLRGANAYAMSPVCPLERTALAVGMDWTWTWGMTDTLISNGIGYSTVDSVARDLAARHEKAFVPGVGDYWMASDHAALALRGVPAWFGGLDGEVRGRPKGWALAQLQSQQSHVPADERTSNWDLSGALFEARFLFELGARVAESDSMPRWTVPSEFRRARERSRP